MPVLVVLAIPVEARTTVIAYRYPQQRHGDSANACRCVHRPADGYVTQDDSRSGGALGIGEVSVEAGNMRVFRQLPLPFFETRTFSISGLMRNSRSCEIVSRSQGLEGPRHCADKRTSWKPSKPKVAACDVLDVLVLENKRCRGFERGEF